MTGTAGHAQPPAQPDAMGMLRSLGARFSPDLDAYASGKIGAHQVRCAICAPAPCACQFCPATYENRYYQVTGRPQFEPCGMRIDPDTGQCPRGSADDHHQQPAPPKGNDQQP